MTRTVDGIPEDALPGLCINGPLATGNAAPAAGWGPAGLSTAAKRERLLVVLRPSTDCIELFFPLQVSS